MPWAVRLLSRVVELFSWQHTAPGQIQKLKSGGGLIGSLTDSPSFPVEGRSHVMGSSLDIHW